MDARARIDRLRTLALVRHLPEAKLEEFARVLDVLAAPAGTLIFEEGDPGDALFLLAEGQVRIEKRVEAGGVKELALLSSGDVFGEMALIERAPRSARAVAHTDATLFVLSRAAIERWLEREPQTTVGFIAELLRVLSHRLRRAVRDLVLLHDVSHLTLQRFEDEAAFLRAVLHRVIPHLDGEWAGAAYLYNEFNDEVTRVATEGPHGASLAETVKLAEAQSCWLDAASFRVALPGKAEAPLGFLLARSETPLDPREQGELEVTLTATAHLVASALQNIRHDTEERLRARLHRQTYGSAP